MMKIRLLIGLGLGISALFLVGLFFLPRSLDSHGHLTEAEEPEDIFQVDKGKASWRARG
ncbi:unnamed protein product [Brassica oleracea var. botrytis]